MWNRAAPPGFVGFDPQGQIRIYHRHLPHWRQTAVTYFTTFRLADSLPQVRLRELAALREQWKQLQPHLRTELHWQKLAKTTFEQFEKSLDEGWGDCVLRDAAAAACVEERLRHFAGVQYDLGAYVIMPNHVHVLVKPYSDEQHPLERIEQGWKSHSARQINAARDAQGGLWQQESFDRIVRDEEHLHRCVQYIGNNPRRAGLDAQDARRWINPEWIAAGWNFDDEKSRPK